MASTASVPVEQAKMKPSFAKVAASSYKPQSSTQGPAIAKPIIPAAQPTIQLQNPKRPSVGNGDAPKVRIMQDEVKVGNESAGNTATRTGQWANTAGQQVIFQPLLKENEPEKLRPAITLVRSSAVEDSTTQLSSSDGSTKPASLDGKSVASATTFALDEKESIRPDDSASLRAVEEEDIASPAESVAAGSRVGSDSGVARAFRDQLHEIAVMGPLPQRGAPPGRFPHPNANGQQTLFDPNQPMNGIGPSVSQPIINGMPTVPAAHNMSTIPDEKLIEALESPRDRLFVLKLEQDFIDFIKDSRENELSLPNCNTFYRMLAHRLADYYFLGHVVDDTMTGVKITRTLNCRIPPPLSGLPVSSKNTSTPPVELPARKIMRRGDDGKSGTNTTANSEGPSKTTSEVGIGSGSDGGIDGNELESKDKSALTREEREARYREARQRIFGNAENEVNDSAEGVGSGEDKDVSRSSSASGKKKTKKQRNYDDDFDSRSRFNPYYPPQYSVPPFGGDQSGYCGGFSGQMQTPQYAGMSASMSPPPSFNSGYPAMMLQDAQSSYGWPGSQYQPANGSIMYPNYGPAQNGYDLSAEFQRGMQSFQTAGMPTQTTPKLATAPMAPIPEPYQPQPMMMNPSWPHMNQQSTYPMAPSPYGQNSPANRPVSAPSQGPVSGQYPYGQFPASPYGNKQNRHQHPIPGSFNRQQFNPQSQTFVPTSRNMSYQMQPNMPSMSTHGMNGFNSFQVPNQMPRPSPPVASTQTFGSPQSLQSAHPVPLKANSTGSSQTLQIVHSQTITAPSSSAPTAPSSISAQSSIAKWGTPAHLPPRPPPPAQAQPPKFNLPGHGAFPSGPRGNGAVNPSNNSSNGL
ncbi:hypothetical protein K491DRAFT_710273 [Lophiostoma macrostomum CBS 122681]|uniref:SUZ domain-containing protein n=1 Tax=Lophiostoma macrostomum CBS 122681 TaxID=1314788 RepID=A0A6A6TTP6_9PLEO|nr:hypothetical protein K491DRAFT_710273 [Lophiostoma macrostomum CBS 122681]